MGFEKKNKPAARVYRSVAQTIPDIIGTDIVFDTENFDTDDMFTPPASKIYVKRLSGYYQVEGSVGFDVNAVGWRAAYLVVNDWTFIAELNAVPDPVWGCVIHLSTPWCFNINDSVRLYVGQHSGGNLNTFPGLFVTWLSLVHLSGR